MINWSQESIRTVGEKLNSELFLSALPDFTIVSMGKEALAVVAELPEVKALVEALTRQIENMAFVINHADLGTLYGKFLDELDIDRKALAPFIGGKK